MDRTGRDGMGRDGTGRDGTGRDGIGRDGGVACNEGGRRRGHSLHAQDLASGLASALGNS